MQVIGIFYTYIVYFSVIYEIFDYSNEYYNA